MLYKRKSSSGGGNGDGSSKRKGNVKRGSREPVKLKLYSSKDISGQSVGASPRLPRASLSSSSTRLLKRRPSATNFADVEDLRTGRGHTGRISAAAVIEALRKTDGMVTIAAKELSVSYNTLSKYIRNNKKIQTELQSIEENILDMVQSKLMTMIDEGNPSAVYFYLKCKGKNRGFIESTHQQVVPTQPITFKYQLVLPENYKPKNEAHLLPAPEKDIIGTEELASKK